MTKPRLSPGLNKTVLSTAATARFFNCSASFNRLTHAFTRSALAILATLTIFFLAPTFTPALIHAFIAHALVHRAFAH